MQSLKLLRGAYEFLYTGFIYAVKVFQSRASLEIQIKSETENNRLSLTESLHEAMKLPPHP